MYPSRTLNDPSLFHHHRLVAVAARERTKELQSRSHSAALVHNSCLLYLYDAHHETQCSTDFPKPELWTPNLVIRSQAPSLSCTLPCRATCIGTRRSAYHHSEIHSHSSRMANLISCSDSSRCVAAVRGSKRSGQWR